MHPHSPHAHSTLPCRPCTPHYPYPSQNHRSQLISTSAAHAHNPQHSPHRAPPRPHTTHPSAQTAFHIHWHHPHAQNRLKIAPILISQLHSQHNLHACIIQHLAFPTSPLHTTPTYSPISIAYRPPIILVPHPCPKPPENRFHTYPTAPFPSKITHMHNPPPCTFHELRRPHTHIRPPKTFRIVIR